MFGTSPKATFLRVAFPLRGDSAGCPNGISSAKFARRQWLSIRAHFSVTYSIISLWFYPCVTGFVLNLSVDLPDAYVCRVSHDYGEHESVTGNFFARSRNRLRSGVQKRTRRAIPATPFQCSISPHSRSAARRCVSTHEAGILIHRRNRKL